MESSIGTERPNYTITPQQSRSSWYLKALSIEVASWSRMDLDALEKTRINHPEILAYKARILASRDEVKEYADWTSFLVSGGYGPRESCLSLGSGIGRVERFLIKAGFTGMFDAIELSPRANKAARTYDPGIDASQGDLNFVHLKSESYDFILCHGILHHLINLEHVLDQVNEALKPDGLLLVYEYVGETRWQFSQERLKVLRDLLPGFEFKPPLVWQVNGFESVRSGDLIRLFKGQFGNACERVVSYGGVYFPFLICTNPEADVHIKRVIAIDEEVSKEGSLHPCYQMGLYHKSDAPAIPARPWSNKELRSRLSPALPVRTRLRRSGVGRGLRAVRGVVRSATTIT